MGVVFLSARNVALSTGMLTDQGLKCEGGTERS